MASRQSFVSREETGFGDPLGDYTEGFNILQFINDNDTPADSPADPVRTDFADPPSTFHPPNPNQSNATIETAWLHPQAPQQAAANNYAQVLNTTQNGVVQGPVVIDGNVMYNGNTRLTDGSPITDISAGGSTSSPSCTSESPFSPDQYNNYLVSQNGNILVGMPDLNGQLIGQIVNQDVLNQHINSSSRVMPMHNQLSPHTEFVYPPQSTPGSNVSQVSPPAINSRYIVPPQTNVCGFNGDMYGSSDGSVCSGNNVQPAAKRKRTDLPTNQPIYIKDELPPQSRVYMNSNNNSPSLPLNVPADEFDENFQRTIRVGYSDSTFDPTAGLFQFTPHMQEQWSQLYDIHQRPLQRVSVAVVADKGFNYSGIDGCFVNQKKNHFQITANIEIQDDSGPEYFCADGVFKKITEFKLAFCGVKAEMPTNEVPIRQSQTDRKPIPHEPVSLEIRERRVTKVTVPRLHFSETTANNNRKNSRPNPDQKYFLLVVRLMAYATDGTCALIQAYQSDRVIVRASNPAQFEQPDNDATWQRNGHVLHFPGPVAIGNDKQIDNAQLSVMGNIVSTGTHTRPSDRRVKENITELDTRDAMSRLAQVRVVEYAYKPEIATEWGLDESSRHRVGVIAQELAQVLPDAVRDNGEFLTVDDTRIFYDTVAAAQELYRLTGNLECKIDQVEKISAKLARFAKNKHKMGSDFTLADKSLSFSRASLASAATTCTEKSTVHKTKHRNCQSGGEGSPCTTRLTQGTIVTLVMIMALCVVAMCTLYVLDWYHRTYVYNPHIHTSTSMQEVVGHLVIKKPYLLGAIPKEHPTAPILAATCGLKDTCPQYCCSSLSKMPKFSPDNVAKAHDDYTNALVAGTSPKTSASPTNVPFSNGVTVRITNLNITLDERFCVQNSCQPRIGRYNLYVPISPFLPTIPLHVQFIVRDVKYVDNCGSLRDFPHEVCETGSAEKATSYKMGENTYELSAGNFVKSAYRFRVGYTTESCNMSEDQQGRSFDEFNIVFYRQCSSLVNAS